MRKKDPEHIGSVISKLMQNSDWEKQLEASRPMLLWRQVVGAKIAGQAQAESMKDGVLQVRVENPVWLSHLRFLAEDLMQKLNRELGSPEIREIRFRQGPLQPLTSPPVSTGKRTKQRFHTPVESSPHLTSEHLRLLKSISDADLRHALETLLRKQLKHYGTAQPSLGRKPQGSDT